MSSSLTGPRLSAYSGRQILQLGPRRALPTGQQRAHLVAQLGARGGDGLGARQGPAADPPAQPEAAGGQLREGQEAREEEGPRPAAPRRLLPLLLGRPLLAIRPLRLSRLRRLPGLLRYHDRPRRLRVLRRLRWRDVQCHGRFGGLWRYRGRLVFRRPWDQYQFGDQCESSTMDPYPDVWIGLKGKINI